MKWKNIVEECRVEARTAIWKGKVIGLDKEELSPKLVACLKKRGEIVRTSFREEIETAKYESNVAKLIGIDGGLMSEIDWDAHRRAIKKLGGTSVKKLLWRQHPTRARLKSRKECKTNRCPLCGEIDHDEHFLACERVKNLEEYKTIVRKKIANAEEINLPQHLIEFVEQLMNGCKYSENAFLKKIGRYLINRER